MGGQLSVGSDVHVVIVGGGFGGIAAAQQLKSNAVSFTLIDVKDAFHHNVAGLRASVQAGFAKQTFIPYAETFGSSFRQGRVLQINPEKKLVVLEGGEVDHFYLYNLNHTCQTLVPGPHLARSVIIFAREAIQNKY